MATRKRTHSPVQRSRRFAGVRGKIVERVEIDAEVIGIYFQDKTALTFDVESINIIYPELSDWRTGNMRSIKKWPAVRSKPSMLSWP
jgi:hypothetical protein